MSKIALTPNASGNGVFTITAPNSGTNRAIALPDAAGTIPLLAAASNTAITSTPAELNILDGVTSTAAELNILDGVTSTAAELNILDGATVVVGEINALDLGSTAVGTAIASKAVILDSNKDYTGIRNLTTSGTTVMPGQPAFLAQPSSSQQDIAINATYTVAFGTERFDQNSNFASNAFTAPVSGRYQLNVNLYLTDLDHDTAYYQFQLNTSNRIYYFIQGTGGFDADHNFQMLGISILADMDASDTVNVTLPNINAGAAQLNIGGTSSSFSGYLVA